VIKATFGDRLDAWVRRLLPFLFVRRLDPNALTVTGSLVSIVAAVALARGAFTVGGILILAGGLFDLVDGVVARHQGRSSSFGAFLDSTLDRLVDMALLVGVLLFYARSGDTTTAVVAAVVLVASVLTSYAKARAETRIEVLEGGLLERGERIVLLAAGAILGWMQPVLWLLAAGTLVTVAQRFAVAYRELESLDARQADEGAAHARAAEPRQQLREGGSA